MTLSQMTPITRKYYDKLVSAVEAQKQQAIYKELDKEAKELGLIKGKK